jgi:hypothetical protein
MAASGTEEPLLKKMLFFFCPSYCSSLCFSPIAVNSIFDETLKSLSMSGLPTLYNGHDGTFFKVIDATFPHPLAVSPIKDTLILLIERVPFYQEAGLTFFEGSSRITSERGQGT